MYEHWLKGAYAVGTESQYILAWQSGSGPSNDTRRFGTHNASKQRTWLRLADAGFDAKNLNVLNIIPSIRRHGQLVDPERKARADLVATARLDGLFGQRWKTKTVNSVIKRKFGGTIRSRKTQLQNREPIIKALIYNIHR